MIVLTNGSEEVKIVIMEVKLVKWNNIVSEQLVVNSDGMNVNKVIKVDRQTDWTTTITLSRMHAEG